MSEVKEMRARLEAVERDRSDQVWFCSAQGFLSGCFFSVCSVVFIGFLSGFSLCVLSVTLSRSVHQIVQSINRSIKHFPTPSFVSDQHFFVTRTNSHTRTPNYLITKNLSFPSIFLLQISSLATKNIFFYKYLLTNIFSQATEAAAALRDMRALMLAFRAQSNADKAELRFIYNNRIHVPESAQLYIFILCFSKTKRKIAFSSFLFLILLPLVCFVWLSPAESWRAHCNERPPRHPPPRHHHRRRNMAPAPMRTRIRDSPSPRSVAASDTDRRPRVCDQRVKR
jgi:hypothetical protein